MLVLSASDQRQAAGMNDVINAVATALKESSAGRTESPIRTSIPVPPANGVALFMPSMVPAADSLGMKVVSVFPDNPSIGKPSIHALVVLADTATGEPLALLEGSSLTVRRTGAVVGLAAEHLARRDAKVLTVIGTGAQARGVVEAVLAVRNIEEVRLFNRTAVKAEEFAEQLRAGLMSKAGRVSVATRAQQATDGADIVVTATNSAQPVFDARHIGPGTAVCGIGSFTPTMQELPADLMQRAGKIVVESNEAALAEAGDLIIPMQSGALGQDRIYAELGEIAAGKKPGRTNDEEITVFKSVGLAAMDVVVAKQIYDRALAASLGQHVEL